MGRPSIRRSSSRKPSTRPLRGAGQYSLWSSSPRRTRVLAVAEPPSGGSARLLLAHAVYPAEAVDQSFAVYPHDLPPRKLGRDLLEGRTVVHVVEPRDQHGRVADVEVRVACWEPLVPAH